jgi:hypothetical protein
MLAWAAILGLCLYAVNQARVGIAGCAWLCWYAVRMRMLDLTCAHGYAGLRYSLHILTLRDVRKSAGMQYSSGTWHCLMCVIFWFAVQQAHGVVAQCAWLRCYACQQAHVGFAICAWL